MPDISVAQSKIIILEQGGYGLGDNIMGMLSLYYLLQNVSILQSTQIEFKFKWPLYMYCEPPPNVTLRQAALPDDAQIMELTHVYFQPENFTYSKFEKAYRDNIKHDDFWFKTSNTITLQCNMPLFGYDYLSDEQLTLLASNCLDQWLKPRSQVQNMIKYIIRDIDVLYHARVGDIKFVYQQSTDVNMVEQLMSGVEALSLPSGAVIYLTTDSEEECLSFAQDHYPQYTWKVWSNFSTNDIKLEHMTFVKKENEVNVLFRTMVEFMLFRYADKVVSQRWSNFSKIGLLANMCSDLEIWLFEKPDSNNMVKITNKQDIIFKQWS